MAIKKKTSTQDNAPSAKELLEWAKKSDKVIKTVSKEKAPTGGDSSKEEIIEAYNLKAGKTVTAKCKLSKIYVGTPKLEKGKEVRAGYFKFVYVVISGDGKGLTLSRYISIEARNDRTVDDAWKDVMFEFQRMGYDTDGFGAADLIAAAEIATEEKPTLMVRIKCNAGKGKNAKEIYVNINAAKPAEDDEEEEESEEEEDDDSEEEESEEEESEEEESEEEESDDEEEESEEEEDDEEEEDTWDEEDPTTWVGYSLKCKPAGTKKPMTYVVKSYSKKTKAIVVTSESGNDYKITTEDIISWVD